MDVFYVSAIKWEKLETLRMFALQIALFLFSQDILSSIAEFLYIVFYGVEYFMCFCNFLCGFMIIQMSVRRTSKLNNFWPPKNRTMYKISANVFHLDFHFFNQSPAVLLEIRENCYENEYEGLRVFSKTWKRLQRLEVYSELWDEHFQKQTIIKLIIFHMTGRY